MLFGGGGITFVATAQNYAPSTTSLVITKPTGTVSGDLMIAVMSRSSGSGSRTWSPPAGWTQVLGTVASASPSMGIAYRIAGASEGANYTFTFSNTANLAGDIITYRGANYDAIGTVSTDSANPITATAVTVASGLLLAVYMSDAASVTLSTPSGFSAVDANSDATAPSLAIFSKLVSSGSSGTVDSTQTGGGVFNSILLSIKPS